MFWHSIWQSFWRSFGHSIWNFLKCVWVQACPTASGAGNIVSRSRSPPQFPELATWCVGPGVTHCIRSWQSERRRRRKELHLCQNLETLTWQVGKNSYTYTQLSRGAPPSCKPGTPSNDGSASAKMSAGCVLLEHWSVMPREFAMAARKMSNRKMAAVMEETQFAAALWRNHPTFSLVSIATTYYRE